jgi:phosphoribosylaminoimidazolecarboxamide formyltransferase/IMP cyclohydrolase
MEKSTPTFSKSAFSQKGTLPHLRALISVSDKTNLVELVQFLVAKNFEIVSTGGTRKTLH